MLSKLLHLKSSELSSSDENHALTSTPYTLSTNPTPRSEFLYNPVAAPSS